MIDGDKIVLNEELDKKFHCMHTPRSAKEAGICFSYVHENLTEKGEFPRMKTILTLPVAIKRSALLAKANDETKELYFTILGTKIEDLTCDYLPIYKKSTFSSPNIFTIKSSIVQLT